MTVSLGGISLSDQLRLEGTLSNGAIAGSARLTLGGVVIQRMAVLGGQSLQLVATKEGDQLRGHFTHGQLSAIAALRDLGEPIELVHHLGTWLVWIPPDGLDVALSRGFANPNAESRYIGTITMITVE